AARCSKRARAMPEIDRRRLLGGIAAAGALAALGPHSILGAAEERDRDKIKAENDREGTTDWQLTYTRIDPKSKCTRFGGGLGGRSALIEGFVSRASVRPRDKLDFPVSTHPPSPFIIHPYPLGSYPAHTPPP